MATVTLGTNATTSLTAVKYLPGYNSGILAADIATINNLIRSSVNVSSPRVGGSYFTSDGILYFPDQKGFIRLAPGDYIGVDAVASSGWPVIVAADAIANGPWTHT